MAAIKSVEEKAKAYDEIMGKAKKELKACGDLDCDAARQIFRFFPELEEGEDERIRKAIINVFASHKNYEVFFGVSVEDILAWLEKQGKQKPAWSEEDEKILKDIKFNFEYNKEKMSDALITQYDWFFDKVKSLKPQLKQEWSEEDEHNLNSVINLVHNTRDGAWGSCVGERIESWLKSLRERYTWRPSDEQMEALDDFIYAKYPNIEKYGAAVKSLYQDLKKLRGA